MSNEPQAVGCVEVSSVARGLDSADAMVKTAQVRLLASHPVCPGKYVILVGGSVAEVNAADRARLEPIWHQLAAEHITTVEGLCAEITGRTVFCGDFLPSVAPELKKRLRRKAVISAPAANLRRAGFNLS